nr:flagellar biosynthetic protein FliO [Thermomicrobium sp. CFH 73360]
MPRRWFLPVGVFALAALVGLLWASTRTSPSPLPTPTPQSGEFLARGYAELASQPSPAMAEGTSLWGLFSAMLVPTLIVIVAAYLTIRVLRSLNRRVAATVSQTKLLELVDTLSLAGSGVVHIVRVGERYLLVGAGSAGLILLGELRPEEVALLESQRRGGPLIHAVAPSFGQILRTRMPWAWRVLETGDQLAHPATAATPGMPNSGATEQDLSSGP